MKQLFTLILFLAIANTYGQNITISDNASHTADASAMLDVYSQSKGMLVPKLTATQRLAIPTPAEGLLVYDTDSSNFFFYSSSSWHPVSGAQYFKTNGDSVYITGNTMRLGVGTKSPKGRMVVVGASGAPVDEPLFEVKNSQGKSIFAVYENEVKVNFVEGTKGVKGGFAIGGLAPGKTTPTEYMRVTPDSVRVYVKPDVAKGVKGGFAIGGLAPGKTTTGNILQVSPGKVQVMIDTTIAKGYKGGFAIGGLAPGKGDTINYMNVNPGNVNFKIDDSGAKGVKGGFAIGGLSPGKLGGIPTNYFNIAGSNSVDVINPSEPRILWYPKKQAFLTGQVLVESVDSVGTNSMATGFESKSIGDYSQALGYKARAKGNNSTAIGYYANANSANSYAFGNYSTAADSGAYAIGSGAIASGLRSFAVGSTGVDSIGNATNQTVASGEYAYAFGMGSLSNDKGAFSFGTNDTASGPYSLALGYGTKSSFYYTTTLGYFTKAERIAAVAMGYKSVASGEFSTAIGKEAVATGYDGAVAIGYKTTASGYNAIALGNQTTASGSKASTAMGYKTVASSSYSTAMGYETNATGSASTAMGCLTQAKGSYSTAIGKSTYAKNDYSTAMGYFSKAFGNFSTAMGSSTLAFGRNTTAMGYSSTARGDYSIAQGFGNVARTYCEAVFGKYNDTTTSTHLTDWSSSDPLFTIGNGTSTSARSNALVLLKNGNLGLGTSSPESKIDINGGIRVKGNTWPSSGEGLELAYSTGTSYIQSYNRTTHSWKNLVIGAGNVYPNRDGVSYLGLSSYKWAAVYAVNGTIQTSDRRLKKNIKTIKYGLNTVLAMKPVSFNWKAKNDKGTKLGLIAQDIQKLIPEIVDVGTDKNKTLGIRYSEVIPVLIKAIQEQEVKINKLSNENLQLKQALSDISKLKAEVEKLKKR